MEGEIQQTFLKPNGNFGMCASDGDDTDAILNSNPRGLGCIITGHIDSKALIS